MPEGDRSNSKNNLVNKILFFFKGKHQFHKMKDSEQVISEIDNWAHYKNLKAEEIMIPRIDIVAIDHKSSLDEICKIFLKSRHTRMPVFNNELDNIIGFINIKDIFPYLVLPQENSNFKIDKIIRKLLIVSPSMKIFDLLEEMKKSRTHIALVVDEFGGSDGLITIEDLVEEIIGEIEDEHDQDHSDSDFKEIKPNIFEANGRIEIDVLEEKLGLPLAQEDSDEKYETLGGLILSISGHVPEKGEKIFHAPTGLFFEILDGDPRRIKKVLIEKASI
jgi:CBS domain containing-hemolysin-like protein